jgi:hypothetical protein
MSDEHNRGCFDRSSDDRTMAAGRSVSRQHPSTYFVTSGFRALDHVHVVAGAKLAFHRDRLPGVLHQLVVHRFVFADQQIGLAVVAFDVDRQAHDALIADDLAERGARFIERWHCIRVIASCVFAAVNPPTVQ